MNRTLVRLGLVALMIVSLLAIAPAYAEQTETNPAFRPADVANTGDNVAEAAASDPRADDRSYQQARRLLDAIDEILSDANTARSSSEDLPSEDDYMVMAPPWVETREDRAARVRRLLDSALEIVTDAPIVQLQDTLADHARTVEDIDDQIAALKAERLDAPDDGLLPGVISSTRASIDADIAELEERLKAREGGMVQTREEIRIALDESGIVLSDSETALLLDSVLGSDLLKLVAAFEAAQVIDQRLARLMDETGDNLTSARRYFGMHAALFAMLVHAQDMVLDRIDTQYIPKLDAIRRDVAAARADTRSLLRAADRDDQRRTLEANKRAQEVTDETARHYRTYLKTQREQIAAARAKTLRDLRIADNTYRTVEASYQLRELIEDAAASFQALDGFKAPGFDRIFDDELLRREFENLTRKIGPTS